MCYNHKNNEDSKPPSPENSVVNLPSPSLQPNMRGPLLVCFDFDRTITTQHTHGVQPLQNLTETHVRRNFRDFSFFSHLCHSLHNAGHRLAIATFADSRFARHIPVERSPIAGAALVLRYMDVAFGSPRPFLQESDMACWYESNQVRGKNAHLRELRYKFTKSCSARDKRRGRFPRERVVLFDDDENNIRRAEEKGYKAFHCPDGLTGRWFHAHPRLSSTLCVNPPIAASDISGFSKQHKIP